MIAQDVSYAMLAVLVKQVINVDIGANQNSALFSNASKLLVVLSLVPMRRALYYMLSLNLEQDCFKNNSMIDINRIFVIFIKVSEFGQIKLKWTGKAKTDSVRHPWNE